MTASDAHHDRLAPLPPGRHGLSRAYVQGHQRERLVDAAIATVAELGYQLASVELITRRAGVSRKTFYELFANKHEVFIAAFDQSAARLFDAVGQAYLGEATIEAKMVAGLRAFLERLAAQPEAARVCIVEVLAAGPEAVERRSAVMREFARIIDVNTQYLLGRTKPLPAMTAETVVGGIYEAIFRRISAGTTAELPALLPDLVEAALLPYLGEDTATATAERLRADAGIALPAGGAAAATGPAA